MLKGRYRDVVADAAGRRLLETPWRSNLLVDMAFTLLATLLKREPGQEGILYWAVGAGRGSWDASRPQPSTWTTGLAAEVRRVEVPPEAIGYIDGRGAPIKAPSPNLQVKLVFGWPEEAVTLREFGLYGGAADATVGSGTMINHVIHDRIDLEPAQTLTRELRLSLGRGDGGRRWLEVPPHWLADAEPKVVEGVGTVIAGTLAGRGIKSVTALADVDPTADTVGMARVPLIELRTKARLALMTAAEVDPPPQLRELKVSQVLTTATTELVEATGAAETEVTQLREQLSTLELALDHRFLGRMTVGSLVEGPS